MLVDIAQSSQAIRPPTFAERFKPPINWQAVNCVTLFSNAKGNALLVLMAIARFVKAEGDGQGTAWPSVQTIEALTHGSRRTVQRALESLQKAGELHVEYGAGEFDTNLYTIPMLTAGGVRSTHELPRYIRVITEDRDSRNKKKTEENPSTDKGSSRVKATPQANARTIREVSLKLADILIASGRKHPGFRIDAESRDWRYGVELLGPRMGFPLDHGFIERLFEFVANSENWTHIQTPKDIHDHYRSIADDLRRANSLDPSGEWTAAGARRERESRPQPEADCGSVGPADSETRKVRPETPARDEGEAASGEDPPRTAHELIRRLQAKSRAEAAARAAAASAGDVDAS